LSSDGRSNKFNSAKTRAMPVPRARGRDVRAEQEAGLVAKVDRGHLAADLSSRCLYWYGKGMARISTKNQITIPVAALEEVGLRAGEQVTIEPSGDGELRIRRSTGSFQEAFGALTGIYPSGYLARLDAEDAQR
jgi:AbrB family looped-hinge helix DNA binding protein